MCEEDLNNGFGGRPTRSMFDSFKMNELFTFEEGQIKNTPPPDLVMQ